MSMKATLEKEPRAATNNNQRQEFIAPAVNILETKDGYVLEAEMPGLRKEGLEVTLEGNEITIIGRRLTEPLRGEALFRECQNTDYRRVFELDPGIDTAKISAKIEQGVLILTLPKSEQLKPRKITVSD